MTTLSIGKVTLIVHDLDRVATFYQRAVGMHTLSQENDVMLLGSGETSLLELRQDKHARQRSAREAGLFHTAFLLPTRADLGAWLKHAAINRVALQGASDHLVSEAIYLADPEGNGVEIYADRPRDEWRWTSGLVEMASNPIDEIGLLEGARGQKWNGFPDATTVGHVHLQVGAIPEAEAFYTTLPDMKVTCRYPGATFYGAHGYHHHLATNVWNSRGAETREYPSTGLADVEIVTDDPSLVKTIHDPWNTSLTFVSR